MTQSTKQTAKIRALNDAFRMRGDGLGSIMLTAGVQALAGQDLAQILSAIRCYDSFSIEEDPWNEHDFGVLRVRGQRVFWKIDYYDPTLRNGADDPANPDTTYRAMTIMLAEEY